MGREGFWPIFAIAFERNKDTTYQHVFSKVRRIKDFYENYILNNF